MGKRVYDPSMPTPELLLKSATELARLIRHKEVSPVEVVEAHIARVQQVNPALNAMVWDRFDLAREEARAAEAMVEGGGDDLPPFLGVPFTDKEAIAMEGAPLTSGSIYRKGVVAVEDATAVARVRDAGAIPLGVTNISEMCMWMESDNVIYGRTGNPYDPSRTCGGSSGGEGALVGAGASPFGVGADIGGSIRMPAFFCGVFGHKPTGGVVPLTGHMPEPEAGAGRISTVGPICRRAEDLMPLLRIMSGPDGKDACARQDPSLGDPSSVSFDGVRVLLCEGLGGPTTRVDPQLVEAVQRAGAALQARGAHIERWSSPLTSSAFQIWGAVLTLAGEASFHSILGEGSPPPLIREWFNLLRGQRRHTLPALALASIEKVFDSLPTWGLKKYAEQGAELRAEIEGLLDGGGVLILPTHPRPAPPHDAPLYRPLDWVYTGLFNAMELPVTAVPMGLGASGLPLGVQIVAPRLQDHRSIAAAVTLEQDGIAGWDPPADQY